MFINIGEKIKLRREEKNVSQNDFADYLGVTCKEVVKWENGELYPDFELVPVIANYFGVSADELLCMEMFDNEDKIREYKEKSGSSEFADTTRKYSTLLALDADFAKKDFDNELLQHRDIDIRLRPLYRFSLSKERGGSGSTLMKSYENALIDRFMDASPLPMTIGNEKNEGPQTYVFASTAEECFVKGLQELQNKQFNAALSWFDKAVASAGDNASKDK